MQEKERLYIPKGAKEKSYYFDGFGKEQLLFILPFLGVLMIFVILTHLILKNQLYTIISFLSGTSFLVIFSMEDENNQSVFNTISNIFLFHQSKKDYEYVMLDDFKSQRQRG